MANVENMERDGIFSALSTAAFLANLAATVLLLALTLWSGRSGRRRWHYPLAALTMLSLAAAIAQAEVYGRGFRFQTWRLAVHLVCAGLALLAVPWVAVTGWRLRTRPDARSAHRRAVGCFVACAGLAILTAGWMFLNAEPRD